MKGTLCIKNVQPCTENNLASPWQTGTIPACSDRASHGVSAVARCGGTNLLLGARAVRATRSHDHRHVADKRNGEPRNEPTRCRPCPPRSSHPARQGPDHQDRERAWHAGARSLGVQRRGPWGIYVDGAYALQEQQDHPIGRRQLRLRSPPPDADGAGGYLARNSRHAALRLQPLYLRGIRMPRISPQLLRQPA